MRRQGQLRQPAAAWLAAGPPPPPPLAAAMQRSNPGGDHRTLRPPTCRYHTSSAPAGRPLQLSPCAMGLQVRKAGYHRRGELYDHC